MSYLSPWYRKVGVELTFCPTTPVKSLKEAERFGYFIHQFCRYSLNTFKQRIKNKKLKVYREPYADDGCVEVPTIPHASWRAFEQTYNRIFHIAFSLNFLPQVDYFGTGGGHVCIDCPDEALRNAVIMDSATRPWLNWCFNDPEDDDAGKSLINSFWWKTYKSFQCDKTIGFVNSRDNAYLEFRGFIAARDWDEQEEHIAFVQKYVEWVNKLLKKGIVTQVPHNYTLPTLTYEQSKNTFLGFIKEIGLPVERYYRYTNKYLKERYRIGNLV